MKRQLFSSSSGCPFGCRYCFAKFSNYERQPLFSSYRPQHGDYEIIYPSCDAEFLLQRDALSLISKIYDGRTTPAVTTFSIKAVLKEEFVRELSSLNSHLVENGKGFLKISISITNISRISEIEPGTTDFDVRLHSLFLLSQYSIPCSVTLKPILPFIPVEEYIEIVRQTCQYTDLFLLGDLYIDTKSSFYHDYIHNKYTTVKRQVDWLVGHPIWHVIESSEIRFQLDKFMQSLYLRTFDSDVKLIEHIVHSMAKQAPARESPTQESREISTPVVSTSVR